eukprot:scaffold149530_cov31-Tisochrysis_lutea.AAC.1
MIGLAMAGDHAPPTTLRSHGGCASTVTSSPRACAFLRLLACSGGNSPQLRKICSPRELGICSSTNRTLWPVLANAHRSDQHAAAARVAARY